MAATSTTSQEMITCFFVFVIGCACALGYPSLGRNRQTEEINTILNELRKELHINLKANSPSTNDIILTAAEFPRNVQANPSQFDAISELSPQTSRDQPLLSALLSKSELDPATGSLSLEVSKRQGNWDFDYGLGGGRFGKRAGFGDYTLGGGRFGRDVDHVTRFEDEVVDFVDPDEEDG
ncbi:uncharacterized protein LOC127848429 [Dreissena polymorpha]|uniref:Cholecystokinin n=1 Tax=Dreissena polymorpha TaxID=45954 RepID=A0A9D4I7X6_DREPO|nr:uncharacterized protein LOC127848429 [Dreissena polymorpha]KAH3751570.1 hypothetical protein DPMN_186137 [Dreissena polymorpha]